MLLRKTVQKLSREQLPVVCDLLSQAITGELIGMSNFASLAEIAPAPLQKMEMVEQAWSRRGHAEGLMNMATVFGLKPSTNLGGHYWRTLRNCLLRYVRKKDWLGGCIMQEVMLECFSISGYKAVGEAVGGHIGLLFCCIADQLRIRTEAVLVMLKAEGEKEPDALHGKIQQVQEEVMTILTQWMAKTDPAGHCGVCKGPCMKQALHLVQLEADTLRDKALRLYVDRLESLGIPAAETQSWIQQLPG